MNIYEKIINEYPLTKKIETSVDSYKIENKKYVILWHEKINKENINDILKLVKNQVDTGLFGEWKTIIIIAHTSDCFYSSELFYFDNINTFVVFYLINEQTNSIFMNDRWIFTLGLNYKKNIRKINEIVKKYYRENF